MSVYTICSKFVDHVARVEDTVGIGDVLFIFAQGNQFTIAVDGNNVILSKYDNIAKKSPIIRYWLSWLAKNPENVESVDITSYNLNELRMLFLYVCNDAVNGKKLIVKKRQDYHKFKKFIETNNIQILTKSGAKNQLAIGNTILNINATRSQIAINHSEIKVKK